MTAGIPDLRPEDFVRPYDLPDVLDAGIPTCAQPGEPGTHWVARGLMAETCARLLARPLTLGYVTRQHVALVTARISLAPTVASSDPQDLVATVELYLGVDSGRWALLLQDRLIAIGTQLPSPAQLADEVLADHHDSRTAQPHACAVIPPSPLW